MTTATAPTLSRAEFDARLGAFVEGLQAKCRAIYAERYPAMAWKDTFTLKAKAGPKFVRVSQYDSATDRYGSVHCFVEIATGKVVKPAGWKAPAKRVTGELQSQYDIATDEGLAAVLAAADPYGSYLYVR